MKHILFKSMIAFTAAGLLLFSCKKDDEKPEPDYYTSSDNAYAQSGFDDMSKVTEDALNSNNSARMATPGGGGSSCATVDTIINSPTSKQVTISFNNTVCADGKKRSGTITAVLTNGATYNTVDAVLTITTSDYTVNGHKLEGKKVITCLSAGAKPQHRVVVSDAAGTGYAKITYGDGKTATWKSTRIRTLEMGGGDAIITNNVYDISSASGVAHAAEGVNRNGKPYTVDILSPIRVDFNCIQNNTARYPTQGELQITPDGKKPVVINYGSGSCDNNVRITFLGKTYDVDLTY